MRFLLGLLLGHFFHNFLGDFVLLLLDGLNERAFQTQAVVAGVDDQTGGVGVLGNHVGVVVKAQQDNLLRSLGLLGLPLVYGIPIAESQVVVLALGAVDHDQTDFGILGQLHTAIRIGLGRRLAL